VNLFTNGLNIDECAKSGFVNVLNCCTVSEIPIPQMPWIGLLRTVILGVIQFLAQHRKYLYHDAMDWASQNGHLDIIQLLHSIRSTCTSNSMVWASENGHLDTIQLLYSIGKTCTTNAMDLASRNGHFACCGVFT